MYASTFVHLLVIYNASNVSTLMRGSSLVRLGPVSRRVTFGGRFRRSCGRAEDKVCLLPYTKTIHKHLCLP